MKYDSTEISLYLVHKYSSSFFNIGITSTVLDYLEVFLAEKRDWKHSWLDKSCFQK